MKKQDFLKASVINLCKTCVLERSRMAVGGGGAALWGLGKTAIWPLKVMFYVGFNSFSESVSSKKVDVFRRASPHHTDRRC